MALVLRSDLLRARAHWITPEFEPKRYDTRFFAALLPAGQIADDQTSEADHADWADPVRLLKDYASGAALMLPPTVVCVEQVAAAASVAEFLAAEVPMAPITPVLTQTDDAVVFRCTLPWSGHLPLAGDDSRLGRWRRHLAGNLRARAEPGRDDAGGHQHLGSDGAGVGALRRCRSRTAR